MEEERREGGRTEGERVGFGGRRTQHQVLEEPLPHHSQAYDPDAGFSGFGPGTVSCPGLLS